MTRKKQAKSPATIASWDKATASGLQQEPQTRWVVAVLIVLPLLVYWNALNNPFLYDDFHSIVENPHVRDLGNIPRFFATNEMSSTKLGFGMYRPMLYASYTLNYAVSGYDPFSFRLVNLLLHVANGLLVFLVCKRISQSLTVGFFASTLFAVHPLGTESINYISCRSNVMATTFYLISVALFLAYTHGTVPWRRITLYSGALLCFVAGILTKAIAITMPVLLVFLDLLVLKPWGKTPSARILLRRHAAFFIIAALHVAWLFTKDLTPTIERRSMLFNLLLQVKAVAFYLKLLVFPKGLCVSHVSDAQGTLNLAFFLSTAVIAAALFLAWRLRKNYGLLSFAALWYFIALLPTSSFLPLNIPVNEHRAYLSGIGFFLAVALLLREGRSRFRSFTYALKKYPHPYNYQNLGMAYRKIGEAREAKEALLRAAKYGGKEVAKAHGGLGMLYWEERDLEKAFEHFNLSMQLDPRLYQPHNNLGILYATQGQFEKAAAHFRNAIKLAPYTAKPYCNLARAYLDMGDVDQAEAIIRELERRGLEIPDSLRKRLDSVGN
jgi:tetratricopeptide (TPR) repeat protein